MPAFRSRGYGLLRRSQLEPRAPGSLDYAAFQLAMKSSTSKSAGIFLKGVGRWAALKAGHELLGLAC